jgi:hypothetical protein
MATLLCRTYDHQLCGLRYLAGHVDLITSAAYVLLLLLLLLLLKAITTPRSPS